MDIRPDFTGQELELVTKGDANAQDDPVPTPRTNVLGVVRLHLPIMGLAALLLADPRGVVLTISLGLLLVVLRDLIRAPSIARSEREVL